jgi:hypothetical protein
MASSTQTVFQIPGEITERTLTFLHPLDVSKFSQTCRSARTLVYGAADQHLWRQLFLAYPFDDPRKAVNRLTVVPEPDWKAELQRRVRSELIAFDIEHRHGEQSVAWETFVSAILEAPPVMPGLEYQQSDSLTWVTHILRDSNILDAPNTWPDENCNHLISRIQTLLALSLAETEDDSVKERLDALRTRSQYQVYDDRNYRQDNCYGPYLRGGQTDWAKAEAFVNVVQLNLMALRDVWMDMRPPVGLEATRAYSVAGAADRPPADWACIGGTWRRYTCFLDYRYALSLQAQYNFLLIPSPQYSVTSLVRAHLFLFIRSLIALLVFFCVGFNVSDI